MEAVWEVVQTPYGKTLCKNRDSGGCDGVIKERVLSMGKNAWKPFDKQNNSKKAVNPILVLLAFLLGAVTAYAVYWRVRASKNGKSGGASGKAAYHGSAQGDREPEELLIKNPQQIKPYRPRKRVSAKKVFGRAVAMTAAAALLVTGFYMAPNDTVPVTTVQARESFGGIRQVVEEHDEDHPFVILDIVPGKAQAEVNGKTYDFSLGTIGYLAPGQSPIQQDLFRIFKGDENGQNTDFYEYTDRKELTGAVIGDGFGEISYQEAYGGTVKEEELKTSLWSRIFDSVEVEHDENGILTDAVPYPTGRLYAHVQKRPDDSADAESLPGFDYNLTGQPEGSTLFSASDMTAGPAEGIYSFAEGQGDYHVIFGEPAMSTSGYRVEKIRKSGSVDELAGSYSETTGMYLVENGVYTYVGMIGYHTGTVTPNPKPKPEEPENPNPGEEQEPSPNPGGEEQEPSPNPDGGEQEPNPNPDGGEQEPNPNPDGGEQEPNPNPDGGEQEPNPDPGSGEQESGPNPGDEQQSPGSGSQNQPAPDQSSGQESESESTSESTQSQPADSAFRTQSVLRTAGTGNGWYLCVNTEPKQPEDQPTSDSDQTPSPDPAPNPDQTQNPDPAPNPDQTPSPDPAPNPDQTPSPDPAPNPDQTPDPDPNPNPAPTDPVDPVNPIDPVIPTDPANPITPETPTPMPDPVPGMPEDGTYCVLQFTYVEAEEEELLYQIQEVNAISKEEGDACPFDSYILEKSLFQNKLDTTKTDTDVFEEEPDLAGQFEYVGGGRGMYRITRSLMTESIVTPEEDSSQDAEMQDGGLGQTDAEGIEEADARAVSTRASESTAVYYVEVQNAPVYIQCTGGKDFLRRYVFNSLSKQDNDSKDFAIKVVTKLAGEVEQKDIRQADLVYLEDGTGLYLNPDAEKRYITPEDAESVAGERVKDVTDEVITCLVEEAVQSLKPIIVDYGIMEEQENGVNVNYKGTKYQKLANVFLKKDLLAFYNEMAEKGNLADNILMNADKDLEDHPNKTDNAYHYVNRNIYMVSTTPLVGDDFSETLDKANAKSGFGEVLAAIRAENLLLPEDERISEKISKAMAVQYIINYSLGLVGEYKDLTILELQPTANMQSDLYPDTNSKGNVVLFWKRTDQKGEGQQILRSSKEIEIKTTLSSVAAFNTSHEDINEAYNMIFIGLDGQRFYHEPGKDGKMITVFNDDKLNGMVYHTGDRVAKANEGTKYDANDITAQKREALLAYLRAGYPIVVENDCFKGRSAQEADEKDINTKYIHEETQMYQFLKEAISMGRSEEDGEENGVGIYTIEDVHSSAMFTMQLNAQRPKIELQAEEGDGGDDSDQEQSPYDMIAAEAVPEKPGILRGTIAYRITSDRAGDDKTYRGSLNKHLYLDLNYDGIYAPEEEFLGYQLEESGDSGRISVDFNEINFGIVPWKLEVRDADNEYRRASAEGCFTISGSDEAKVRVLQILDNTGNQDANFQKQYEDIENSTLAHYLSGAEAALNMKWDIEAVTPGELADRITKNANYLSLWDVVALGFGDSGNPGDMVMNAVNAFIDEGGSVLVSSAGASADRVGLSAEVLGQKNEQTYGKLSMGSESKFRYEGMKTDMFEETTSLLLDRINDGTIARWPYEINRKVQLADITALSVPDYLLDIDTAKDGGRPYATAWFTLTDQEVSDGHSSGGYSVSPHDGRNNYYVYSKGNVVYVGQSIYRYYFEKGKDAPSEGDGIEECKILTNALIAAYSAGVHRANVSIVAGFNGKTKVESVTVPFDIAFKEGGDTKGGILGDMVDVYFCFTDNNIAVDKVTERSFFYRNAGVPETAELLLPGGGINTADYTEFTSPVWAVENNRLVEVTGGIVPGKVYRIKAPLEALQTGDDRTSQICVLLKNHYTRAGQDVDTFSIDSVSLNRAQMFLLE